jgi:predicted nucleic acid-binding protein
MILSTVRIFTVMMEDKRLFLDTNILLAASDQDRRHHRACFDLLESALGGEASFYASGQVFREYLVVATRPTESNGLGMSRANALKNVEEFRLCIQALEETSAVLERLINLVRHHRIQGKRIHDANLAAAMLEHGLRQLVTLNPEDFKVFPDLILLGPDSIVAQ